MSRKPTIVGPDQGRVYGMGQMRAVFKADGGETAGASSVSEWWLEANTEGPPAHEHPEDHAYYVIAGVLSVWLDGEWCEAERGSCVLIPGGTGTGSTTGGPWRPGSSASTRRGVRAAGADDVGLNEGAPAGRRDGVKGPERRRVGGRRALAESVVRF